MADIMRLLVVEDDEGTIADWKRAIELHNANQQELHFTIDAWFAESYSEAERAIFGGRFDAAVIDLRLKAGGAERGHNTDGNRVTGLLTETAVAAIAIYSGQPAEAVNPASSPQIRTFEKGAGLGPVMEWLASHRVLARSMQAVSKAIEKDMAAIFHSSIWPRWRLWMANADPADIPTALTRHFVSHLHAVLLEATGGKVHAEESYFVPVATTVLLSTGDLIERGGGAVEIVVTPRCDLARVVPKVCQTIQLARCEDISAIWDSAGEGARREIRQHRKVPVQHFLPRMQMTDGTQRGPWFVRFDRIVSIDNTEALRQELRDRRFATLTPDYVPSLVERLGGYFSRIGTPVALPNSTSIRSVPADTRLTRDRISSCPGPTLGQGTSTNSVWPVANDCKICRIRAIHA